MLSLRAVSPRAHCRPVAGPIKLATKKYCISFSSITFMDVTVLYHLRNSYKYTALINEVRSAAPTVPRTSECCRVACGVAVAERALMMVSTKMTYLRFSMT